MTERDPVSSAMANGPAERKRQERARMRAKGYVLKHSWVHPLDWPVVQRMIERLARRRNSKQQVKNDHFRK